MCTRVVRRKQKKKLTDERRRLREEDRNGVKKTARGTAQMWGGLRDRPLAFQFDLSHRIPTPPVPLLSQQPFSRLDSIEPRHTPRTDRSQTRGKVLFLMASGEACCRTIRTPRDPGSRHSSHTDRQTDSLQTISATSGQTHVEQKARIPRTERLGGTNLS